MDVNTNARIVTDVIYQQNTNSESLATSGDMATSMNMMNITSDLGKDDELEEPSLVWLILVPLVVGTIIIVTVIGNALVVLAYWRDRRIHGRVANLLIVNLAIADFIVGLIVLSVNLAWITWVEVLGDDAWLLGETFCKIWLVIDYTATMVSVLTIILISLDRYWMLSKKLRYNSFQTRKRVSWTITIIWIVTVAVYAIVTFAWTPITGESAVDFTVECELDMTYNVPATVVQLFLEFVFPLWAIIVLNIIVYVKIRKRAKGLKRMSGQKTNPKVIVTKENRVEPEGQSFTSGASAVTSSNVTLSVMNNSDMSLHQESANHVESTFGENSADNEFRLNSDYYQRQHEPEQQQHHHQQHHPQHHQQQPKSYKLRAQCVQRAALHQNAEQSCSSSQSQKSRREFARERRSAIVLAVLVSVFIACWLPYQIVNVINALCGGECVSYLAWEVVNNILWCNSFVNPFLYAATNVHFRRNFVVFLGLKRFRCANSTMKTASRPSSTVEVVRRSHRVENIHD